MHIYRIIDEMADRITGAEPPSNFNTNCTTQRGMLFPSPEELTGASIHKADGRLTVRPRKVLKPRDWLYTNWIALTFDMHLDRPAVEIPVKFQRDWKTLNMNIGASASSECPPDTANYCFSKILCLYCATFRKDAIVNLGDYRNNQNHVE